MSLSQRIMYTIINPTFPYIRCLLGCSLHGLVYMMEEQEKLLLLLPTKDDIHQSMHLASRTVHSETALGP